MGLLHYSTLQAAAGGPARERGAPAARRHVDGCAQLRELEAIADRRSIARAASDGLIDWLCEWGFTAFWSLTFNPEKFPSGVTPAQCSWLWRHVIVEHLNTELYGNHYRRIVGHSYFGYVVGIEPHKSGALHLHACTTDRTNWSRACELWQAGGKLNVGTIHIRRIVDAPDALRYTLKYTAKGGDLLFYRPDKHKEPAFEPMWYMAAL